MTISKDDVLYTAKLARLSLGEDAMAVFADQIGKILGHMDTLRQVDTAGVTPMSHAISLTNAFREDKVILPADREKALANAPDQEEGQFVVPKIIG